MKKLNMPRSFALGFVLAIGLIGVGTAYAQQSADPSADPPDRVARISYIQGKVSFDPGGPGAPGDQSADQNGEGSWQDAAVNRPLTSGDKLWVDAQSRAELQVGTATLHVDQNTAVSLLSLDDQSLQLRLTGGGLNLRVRELGEHETVEIDTPNVAVSVIQPGEYHVEVNDAGDATLVRVRSGELTVSRDTQNFAVRASEQGTFNGNDQLMAQTSSASGRSSFEEWSHDRDTQDENARSREYVAPEVIGAGDLDASGSWSNEPDYGEVWYPAHVEADWAPYRYGHWAWVDPWGWTWIDQASWGFAPFHYGRWAYLRSRWCWVPGPRHERPVYAPALVAWVGGPRASVSVNVRGGPGVGWFPLAPREVYVPTYRVSPRYVQHVNVTNTVIVNKTYITNVYENRVTNIHYANRTAPRGLTVVRQETFTASRPVARNLVHANEHDLKPLQRTAFANIRPDRAAIAARTAAPDVRRPPAQLNQRSIVARHEPNGSAEFNRARHVAAPTASAPASQPARTPVGVAHRQENAARPTSPAQAPNAATNLRMQRSPDENRDPRSVPAAGANSERTQQIDRPDWAQHRNDHMMRNNPPAAETHNVVPQNPAAHNPPAMSPPAQIQNPAQRAAEAENMRQRQQQENLRQQAQQQQNLRQQQQEMESRMARQRDQEAAARAARDHQQAEHRPVMAAPAAPPPRAPEASRPPENRVHQEQHQNAAPPARAPAPAPRAEAPHNNPPPRNDRNKPSER